MYDDFADVAKEYEKNKELKKADVQLLQEWAAKQQHLPKVSDLDLILFLHRCYYNIESTKKCIDCFYSIRVVYPEIFKNRNPTINTKITETVLTVPLPKPTRENYQIIYVKMLNDNPDNFVFDEHIKSFDMITTLTLHQTGVVPGHVMLMDLANMTYKHVLKISLITTRKLLFYMQEVMPIRLKKVIIINAPPCVQEFMILSRPFFTKEFIDKLHVYNHEYKEVYQTIPKECFPSDYGGESGSIEELTEKSREMLLSHEDFFVEDEKAVADESKRAGRPVNIQDIFNEENTILSGTYVG